MNDKPNSSAPLRIAVVGAGLIGRRHIDAIKATDGVILSAIADPQPEAQSVATSENVPQFESFEALLNNDKPDAAIIATPNQRHLVDGLTAINANVPALIEKPIASSLSDGEELVAAAKNAGVALLIGHHRRHNPLIQAAKKAITEGKIGEIVSVHAMFWLIKPDDYFEVAPWRTQKGAGPVLVNFIHDIDLLCYLAGPVVESQAFLSNKIRGNPVEESAAVILKFENSAIGTVNISDTISAPWSWEMTTGENPVYPRTNEACYLIGGTHGSLEIPTNRLWHHTDKRSWWEPITNTILPSDEADPLIRQVENLRDVIHSTATPLVSGEDGLAALRVVEDLMAE